MLKTKMMQRTTNHRFLGLDSNPQARYRLFCFPFAGGGAAVFREWRLMQGEDLEIVAVELPGRGKRFNEPLLQRLPALANDLLEEFPVDKPFAMFGHSMGGLLAFEVARAFLAADANSNLAHLFISAFRAIHLPQRTRLKHLLPDDELIEELERMEGTPPELLVNPEALEVILPPLRADLTVVETYAYLDSPALKLPITVFGGSEDKDVSEDELLDWNRHTSERFKLQMIGGNHFFLYEARDYLLNYIRRELGLVTQRLAQKG